MEYVQSGSVSVRLFEFKYLGIFWTSRAYLYEGKKVKCFGQDLSQRSLDETRSNELTTKLPSIIRVSS